MKGSLCAQGSSLEEVADAVASFCLDVLPTDKFQLKRNHPYYFQVQLQMFASKRGYCDFVVWTTEKLHIKRITLDEDLMKELVPKAERFYKLCILPELLEKWFTRLPVQLGTEQTLQLDE